MYRYISKDATTVNDEEIKTTAENAEAKEKHTDDKPLYEGPLSGITTRLKIVSITTASGSMLGIPYLIMTHSGDLHLMGQLAVGGACDDNGSQRKTQSISKIKCEEGVSWSYHLA
jgi:hypothetical protein